MGAVGENRLCCISKNRFIDGELFIPKDLIKDVWESSYFKDCRTKMLQGVKLDECQTCYKIEASGGKSDREYYNEVVSEDVDDLSISIEHGNAKKTPIVLDLRPSNRCNLICRMCNSENSAGIGAELKKNPKLKKLLNNSHLTKLIDWFSDDFLYSQIKSFLKNSYKLKLQGGEPLILKSVHEILKYCVDNGFNENLILDITSNCFEVSDQMFELINNFNTWFHVSIDGVAEVNEYIRYPSIWPVVEKNIKKLLNNKSDKEKILKIRPMATVSIYNVLYISDIIRWWEKISDQFERKESLFFNMVFYPDYLSIDLLPDAARVKASQSINKVISDLELDSNWKRDSRIEYVLQKLQEKCAVKKGDRNFDRFVHATVLMDEIRKQNIQYQLPEVYSYFKDEIDCFKSLSQ